MKPQRAPPAYMEYAANTMANIIFRGLSMSQRGLLSTMKMECWVNGCVPSNPATLARLFGADPMEIAHDLQEIIFFFEDLGNGFIDNKDLIIYRAELAERKRKQSEGGKKGAKTTNKVHESSSG